MGNFDEILEHATAALAPGYFQLPVAGGDPVYRERVYCYEFYHQMRCRWPTPCDYVLNGEVDKQQHPEFADRRYPKPDFIVHVPGSHDNFAVVEVKGPGASAGAIRDDLCKLLRFAQWYQRSLYLVYGVDPGEAADRIKAGCNNKAELDAIELWVHSATGVPARKVRWDCNEELRA